MEAILIKRLQAGHYKNNLLEVGSDSISLSSIKSSGVIPELVNDGQATASRWFVQYRPNNTDHNRSVLF
jgi:hypothetical protein